MILMADDDADDRDLAREALEEAHVTNELRFVEDGQELMDYLRHEGRYRDERLFPRPGIVLLDLNMPRMDGREALEEIKNDPDLRSLPIVVLTTSKEEEDVLRSYELGVNSFVVKPVTFSGLVNAMKVFAQYWLSIVELPATGEPR